MHHLKRSPCTMAAASMHNLAGHGAQFRRKRCAKAAELSPRLLHTLDAEVEHPRRRNWTENDTGSHCPEHWLWGAGTVALTRRTPGSEASEYSSWGKFPDGNNGTCIGIYLLSALLAASSKWSVDGRNIRRTIYYGTDYIVASWLGIADPPGLVERVQTALMK